MSGVEKHSFVFVGDVEVGKRLSSLLVEAGFPAAPDASSAQVVLTYCSNMPALEDVYYDSEGLLQTAAEDAILIDLSPATPTFARELYAVACVNERFVLDAPLIVRNMVDLDAFGRAANVGMMVGGDLDIYRQVEPLLHALAAHVLFVGAAGAGQTAKCTATLQTAAALVGLVEAYASMKASEVDVDGEEFSDFMMELGAMTPLQQAFVDALQEGEFEGSFSIEYLMGEVAAALSAVDDSDIILPQAEAGFRLMELLAMVGGVDYNPAALRLVFADEATSQRYGLDWSRAEGAYEHDHECSCGHDHGGSCDCDHDEYESYDQVLPEGFVGFSSN